MAGKRLTRSKERVFLGVCGGIANYLNIDPTIVRVLYVLLSLGSFGTGLLIYILLAIILPEDTYVGTAEEFNPEEEIKVNP